MKCAVQMGSGVMIYMILVALVVSEWSASRPGRFTHGETAPGTRLIGGWVGPRDGLDAVE
jgi:hypothetical protein